MNGLLKKPYQISLWEDRVYYVYSKNGTIYETDSLPVGEDFTLINEYTKELRLAIIGSDTMESNIKAINPILTRDLNGSNNFSFQLPYRYYDESLEDFQTNPFTTLMINERKLKLNYDGEWFEFIVKNIQENNSQHLFTYEAIDLHINELSKNGYNIQLETEMQNNMGTSDELGARVLEDTEWQVVKSNEVVTLSNGEKLQSEVIQQTKVETLMIYHLTESITAVNMRNKSQILALEPGAVIYIPQSSFSAGEKHIQFFYTQDKFEVDKEGIIIDAINWECATPGALYVKDSNGNIVYGQLDLDKVTVSREYRGESLIKKQKSKYLPIIERYCDLYEKEGTQYYGYSTTEYADPSEIQNILTNSYNFDVDSGWYTQGGCTVEPVYSADEEGNVISVLHMVFIDSEDAYVINDGFHTNRAKIGAFTKGEKFYFAAKVCGEEDPLVSAEVMAYYVTKDPDKVKGKIYYYLDKNRNYTRVKANEVFTSNRLYFEGVKVMTFGSKTQITSTTGDMADLKGYNVWTGQVTKSLSATEVRDAYDLVFQLYGSDKGKISDFKLFRHSVDKNGKIIVPNLTEDCESIVEEKYHFFEANQLTNNKVVSIEDVVYSDVCLYSNIEKLGYSPVYSDNYEKVTSINGSKSNCFNLIQTLCENFECWAKFVIDHNNNGEIIYQYRLTKDEEVILGKKYYKKRIGATSSSSLDSQYEIVDASTYSSPANLLYERVYSKYVCFKKFIGQDNFAGFRYGINLKSIQRTIESNQIVTKLIVEPNSNEYAPSGFCSIQKSQLNPLGESVIYNFDYYINKGLLHKEALYDDLYGTAPHCIGYFVNTERINRELEPIIQERVKVASAIDKYSSDKQAYEIDLEKALQQKADRIELIDRLLNANKPEDEKIVPEEVTTSEKHNSLVNQYIIQRDQFDAQAKTWEKLLASSNKLLKKAEAKYTKLTRKELEGSKKKLQLERAFYRKYSRYIQEGTWQSEDYYDDNLYYLDALSVSYTSAYPQISYSINVLELSQVQGFGMYSFKIGDKTYVEDTEFFGWDVETGRPHQEEIVVSQVKIHLDDPTQNNIKVQNYKTQFEDLFQRIAATTQSLQYASGQFKRASDAIKADGSISSNIMQNSLMNNSLIIQNAKDQSVVWDNTGITITSVTSPNEIVRLTSGGMALSSDGGRNWTTGVGPQGINASVITTGRLDTNRIRIFNETAQTFEWNSKGIHAYEINKDGKTLYNNFIRFDQYGIYRYVGKSEDFDPSANLAEGKTPEDIIEDNSTFSLTKKGVRLKSSNNEEGYLLLRVEEDGNYLEIGNNDHTAKFGLLDTEMVGPNENSARELRRIIDINDGQFIVYDDGSLVANNGTFTGNVDASSFKINQVNALNSQNQITGRFLSLSGVSVKNSNNDLIFAVNTEDYPDQVFFSGKINMSAGSTIDWAQVNEENLDQSSLYKTITSSLGNITGTSISGTRIESPVILSGKFRAQSAGKTLMSMTSNGLYMRKKEASEEDELEQENAAQFDPTTFMNLSYVPEKLVNPDTGEKIETGIIFPSIFLGMGQSANNYVNKGLVMKMTQGLWIGDSDNVVYERDNDQQLYSEGWSYIGDINNPAASFTGTGIMINFNDKQIYVNCNYAGADISLPLEEFIKLVIRDNDTGAGELPKI